MPDIVLPAEKVKAFFTHYAARTYQRREILIQAGEEPEGIFYLTGGRVSQYDIMPNGTEVVVNIFKPGAFFPMSWAINKTPNQYFFEAATNVTAHRAPAGAAVAFLQANPDVAYDLLARVYRGTDGVLRRMAYLMGGDAQKRVLFELLNAYYRFGEPQTDGSTFVPMTEGALAKQSGLTRETVSRMLSDLRQKDLLTARTHGIVIRDVESLEALLARG